MNRNRTALRVAVDARSLLCKEPRGEGKSLLRLYEQIRALRPHIELVFFGDSSAGSFDGQLPQGSRLIVIPSIGERWNVWEDLLFPARAKLAGCHLMHCTRSGAPRHTLMPMVMTVHDLIPILFDDGQDETARRLFTRRLSRGLQQAGQVLAVSDHTRQDLLRLYPDCRSRLSVVHWGADRPTVIREEPPDGPSVLVFGGEARRKNTDYSIDRFMGAAQRVPGLRLSLIGITSERQREALARKLGQAGLGGQVSMPGFVSETDLAALMRSSTMLLYLSLYEGFGLPVLEAIAHGLPVLASDCTSIPEVLSGAPGCWDLEEPLAIEDAIVMFATDADACRLHAHAQAGILPRFEWAIAAQRVLDAFDVALALPRRPQMVTGPTHPMAARRPERKQGENK